MEINNLENTPIEIIVDALVISFQGYFVPIPNDVNYWKNRLKNAQYSPKFSWGVFDNNNLIAFILNCSALKNGVPTLFNTGTGVLPSYRGNSLVDKMYTFGLSDSKQNGIGKCTLEVIQENARAIKVYERIGFNTTRELYCFQGELSSSSNSVINIPTHLESLENNNLYSWDFSSEIIQHNNNYETFKVLSDSNKLIGYFTINPENGVIAQLETDSENWELIFEGISQITTNFKITNIDSRRKSLITYLQSINASNTVNQYEMEMNI